jgi:hypothetical protein
MRSSSMATYAQTCDEPMDPFLAASNSSRFMMEHVQVLRVVVPSLRYATLNPARWTAQETARCDHGVRAARGTPTGTRTGNQSLTQRN